MKEAGNLPYTNEIVDRLDAGGFEPFLGFLGAYDLGCGGGSDRERGKLRTIHAGAYITKVNHVIGSVDEARAEAAKPMKLKSSDGWFGNCVDWIESVAESEDDVFVGKEVICH